MGDSRTSLYFTNLKAYHDEELLKRSLSDDIEPLSYVFLKNKVGQRTGCAIINFKTPEDAFKAYECFQESGFMVRYARASKKDSTNVFVTNIPRENFEEANLRFLFGRYGEIASVKLFKDDCGRNTGIGFVRFQLEECANYAIRHVNANNIRPNRRSQPLFCKLAELKERKEEATQSFQSGQRCLLESQPAEPPMLMLQANVYVQPVVPQTAIEAPTRYQTPIINVPQMPAIYYKPEQFVYQGESATYAQRPYYGKQNLDFPTFYAQEP